VFRQAAAAAAQQHQLTPSVQSVSPLHQQGMSFLSHFLLQLSQLSGYFMCSAICFNSSEFCMSPTADLFVSCDCHNQQQLLP